MAVKNVSGLEFLTENRMYGPKRISFTSDDSERNKRQKLASYVEFDMEVLSERCVGFHGDYALGMGSSGIVFYVMLNDLGSMTVRYLYDRVSPLSAADFEMQVNRVALLDHENVIKLHGFSTSVNPQHPERAVVYEYAEHLSLYDNLHDTFGQAVVLSWDKRLDIAIDAARGLQYLHQQDIAYEDFKSKNVLLFEGFRAKIADINLRYRDPDLKNIWPDCQQHSYGDGYDTYDFFFKEGDYDKNTDIYSFGVVLMEILTGMKCSDRSLPGCTIFKRALPFLGKKTLEGILDPKLGHFQLKAAEKVAALAVYCVLPPSSLRPDIDFVLRILTLIREDPDAAQIKKRIRELESCLGDQDWKSGVAAEILPLLTQEKEWSFFSELDRLYPKLSNVSKSKRRNVEGRDLASYVLEALIAGFDSSIFHQMFLVKYADLCF